MEIALKRDPMMRGYTISGDEPVALVKRRTLWGKTKYLPVTEVIIKDRVFMLTSLKV